jgi:hypothetical protein
VAQHTLWSTKPSLSNLHVRKATQGCGRRLATFFPMPCATVLAYCEDSTERLSMGALVLWVDGMDHLKDRSDVSKKMSDMGHIQFIYSNSSEWIVLFHHHPSTNFSLSLTSSSLPHPPFGGGGGIAPFPIGSPSNIAGHE